MYTEKKSLTKTQYKATIFDGHSHIERRVYEDYLGMRYVSINGWMASIYDLEEINHFEVKVWYDC